MKDQTDHSEKLKYISDIFWLNWPKDVFLFVKKNGERAVDPYTMSYFIIILSFMFHFFSPGRAEMSGPASITTQTKKGNWLIKEWR